MAVFSHVKTFNPTFYPVMLFPLSSFTALGLWSFVPARKCNDQAQRQSLIEKGSAQGHRIIVQLVSRFSKCLRLCLNVSLRTSRGHCYQAFSRRIPITFADRVLLKLVPPASPLLLANFVSPNCGSFPNQCPPFIEPNLIALNFCRNYNCRQKVNCILFIVSFKVIRSINILIPFFPCQSSKNANSSLYSHLRFLRFSFYVPDQSGLWRNFIPQTRLNVKFTLLFPPVVFFLSFSPSLSFALSLFVEHSSFRGAAAHKVFYALMREHCLKFA